MNLKLNNIFDSIPEDLESEVFENIIQNGSMRVERIISRGHSTPAGKWYDQTQSEWVLVLKGAATISIENEGDHALIAGSYLNIPAHTRHRVKWTTPEIETLWLAIHY